MKKLLALILLLPLTVTLADGSKTFQWTPPTQYVDGTPLNDADIASYNIYCNGSLLANVTNTGGTDVYESGLLPTGTYSCTATTVTVEGVESAESNSTNFTVDPSVPEAPSGFTVILP